MKTIRVSVGSANPVKLQASHAGLRKALLPLYGDSEFEIVCEGFNAPSGVSDQPIGDKETKTGAMNRARAAFKAFQDKNNAAPDYAVGLEGGVVEEEGELACSAYMAVCNSADEGGIMGTARTCSFPLPPAIRDLVKGGMELGDADDAVFGSVNSKQQGGTVGHLTRGAIDRSNYYVDAVALACVPLLWPEFWTAKETN
jgi:inosine/xanthosine triphosphatase